MNALPIFLSAIVAFGATLSAGIFIRKLKSNIGVVCAFSAGFFVALSIFDLLPEILTLAPQTRIPSEKILVTAIAGFALLFAFDRGFSSFHTRNRTVANRTLRPRIGMLSTLEFCSHAFLEGMAIGVSFQIQIGLGIFVAIAVVSHDFYDGISTLALMLDSGNSLKSAMGMLFVDAIAPLLGATATLFFAFQSYFVVYALSFLFGSFLYIGSGTLLLDAYRMNRPIVAVVFFLLGFLSILFSTRIINGI